MTIKIALYQFNPVIGDISGNTLKLHNAINVAKKAGADVFLTSELAICGYPPEDLLLRRGFHKNCADALDKLLDVDDITMLIGSPYYDYSSNECYNSIFALRDGNILGRYDKMLLPNYGVFDECRYFSPGVSPLVINCKDINIGVVICEDMWQVDPIAESVESGAELILVSNASPFETDKLNLRLSQAIHRVEENSVPLIYLNQVGGQDELIFDGASFVIDINKNISIKMSYFTEELRIIEYNPATKNFVDIKSIATPLPAYVNPRVYHVLNNIDYALIPQESIIYNALVLSLRDYVHKNGFSQVLISFSGGIDSALALAISVDALGSDNVRAVMLPSQYTADISLIDSREMATRLNIKYDEIPIVSLIGNYFDALSNIFINTVTDVTEENIQARIRGNLIMAISNKFKLLVISTSNKSEMATGYATLYGDMCGGFAILKDVYKTLVYKLAKWRNLIDPVIPERIINRAPSAELRENQTDQDSLPDYEVLDAILFEIIENDTSAIDLLKMDFLSDDVNKITKLLKLNEYKRRQGAIGPKITTRSFAKDWRYPVSALIKF